MVEWPGWRGQGQHTVRWLLSDADGVRYPDLHPLRAGTLSHDAAATIARSVTGVVLAGNDATRIDPLTARIDLVLQLPDAVGRVTDWPLGRYLVADDIRVVRSGGDLVPVPLYDQMIIVDQELDRAFDAAGLPADEAARRLVDGLPVGELDADSSDFVVEGAWSAGQSRGTALGDIARYGGYLPPWFTHDGRLRMVRAFEPGDRPAVFDLDDPPRVLADSPAVQSDVADAPNRWIVVGNGDADTPMVGAYDVPSSAPHSIARRGYAVVRVEEAPVVSAAQAAAYARSLGITHTLAETATVATPVDPRHDGWDVVAWRGHRWLETGWSIDLSSGVMEHDLRRAWPTTDEEQA